MDGFDWFDARKVLEEFCSFLEHDFVFARTYVERQFLYPDCLHGIHHGEHLIVGFLSPVT